MTQKIVLGFGTGRCGTKSLAAFLNQQPGYLVTHEKAYLSWYPALSDSEPSIKRLFTGHTGSTIGDVGFYWVNYLGLVLRRYENTKAINIRRPLDEVIESFWSFKEPRQTESFSSWFSYPFDSDTMTKDDIALSVRRYRFLEVEAQKIYPASIYVMETQDLSDDNRLSELLDWLGSKETKMLRQFFMNTRGEILKRSNAPSIPFEGVLRRKDALP